MNILELIKDNKPFLSLEFFPPKNRTSWPEFFQTVQELKKLAPLFVSVTYGAGGSNQTNTLEIVNRLKNEYGLEPMAHLTCIGADKNKINSFLNELQEAEVHNVLALRGDPPAGESFEPQGQEFGYAQDLVEFIKQGFPQMGIAVAGYPEGHIEAKTKEQDLLYLKQKLDAGAEFVITQLFFDNELYFDFVRRAREIGITQPIIPGILPIVNLNSLKRILPLCGASIPDNYLHDLEHADRHYGNIAVKGIGLAYARQQVEDLLKRGVAGVHLYSLNRADACLEIFKTVQQFFTAEN